MPELPGYGPLPRPKSLEEARETLKQEAFRAPNVQTVKFKAHEFTSVCPKTGQPDFGSVEIVYQPKERCIESKALKFYLWAYREEGAFAEELAGRIADDVVYAIDPEWVEVTVMQSRRGGIDLEATAVRGRSRRANGTWLPGEV